MYSYIFFALFIVGIFSIIENIKGAQKFTFFKINIQILLIFISINSFLYFLDEIGFDVIYLTNISRILGILAMVNIYFILANNKIPKFVIYCELFYIIIYILMFLNGFSFLLIKNGVANGNINLDITLLQWFNIFFINFFIFFSMAYNINKIHLKFDNNNLYHIKIKNWSFLLLIFLSIVIIFTIIGFVLYTYQILPLFYDIRLLYITLYFILFLFILVRPKFIDEVDFSYSFNIAVISKNVIKFQDFEFLFYASHYYLQSEASLEDFSLKLNHSKDQVKDFLKSHTNDNFSDLLNKNRIKYFKELLKSNKQDSFTIEALSEMAGFGNRQSMYNAFNKYEGCSPSEYISSL